MEDGGRKAVRLARTEGIGRVFQRATDPDRWGHHYVSAALALFDIQKRMLHGTNPERKAAKALWQSACGLGRGQRTSLERSRLRRWVRAVVDSSSPGDELRTAIHEAGLSSEQSTLLRAILKEIEGNPDQPRSLVKLLEGREIKASKRAAFAILDALLHVAGETGFKGFKSRDPGERIRKLYEGR